MPADMENPIFQAIAREAYQIQNTLHPDDEAKRIDQAAHFARTNIAQERKIYVDINKIKDWLRKSFLGPTKIPAETPPREELNLKKRPVDHFSDNTTNSQPDLGTDEEILTNQTETTLKIDGQEFPIGNNVYEGDKEENFNVAISDFLSLFEGRTNPYTHEKLHFTSPEQAHQEYPIQYCGLLWKRADLDRLMTEIKQETLSFEMFSALIRESCELSHRPVPSLSALEEAFIKNKNPQEALKNILFLQTVTINREEIPEITNGIREFPIPQQDVFRWNILVKALSQGTFTIQEYVELLVEVFDELKEKSNWMEVQEVFFRIRHNAVFYLITDHSKNPIDNTTLHSLLGGGIIMDKIVNYVKKT